jgi:hypothetical protein
VEQKGNIKRSERQRNHRAEQKKKQKTESPEIQTNRDLEREKKGNCQPNRKHKGIGIQRKLTKKIIFTFVF